MKLQWYGTAALRISDGDTAIAFDPFLGIPKGSCRPESVSGDIPSELRQISDVFVTHGHFDHMIQIPALYAAGSAVIHATRTPCATLEKHGIPKERLDVISPGGHYSVGTIAITVYQGRHCVFDKALVIQTALRYLRPGHLTHGLRLLRCNKNYPENGETLFYELECRGERWQIMGSMGLDPEVTYPAGADLLILPYQGKSRPEVYAASLVARLQPQAVLLDHYDDSFPPMTAPIPTTAFETDLTQRQGIPCRAMRRGIIYDTEEILT